MKRILAVLVSCAVILSAAGCTKQTNDIKKDEGQDEKKALFVKEEASFDISPKDDFYGYVNANALWNEDIKYGENSAGGGFYACHKLVFEDEKKLIKKIAASDSDYEKGSPEQLIKDYYYQCKEGSKDVTPEFDRVFKMIDSVRTPDDILELGGKLLKDYGVNLLFSPDIMPNYYKKGEYVISFSSVDISDDLREFMDNDQAKTELRNRIRRSLNGFGIEYNEAEKRADSIIFYLEDCGKNTDIDSLLGEDMEKLIHIYTVKELDNEFQNIGFAKYADAYGVKNYPYENINVTLPEQMKVVNDYLTDEHIQMFKDLAKFRFLTEYEEFAPESYVSHEITEKKLPDEEIMKKVINDMSYEISELYRREFYTEKYEEAMHKLEQDLKKAYVKTIRQTEWLSDDGKDKLVKKFNNITFLFGGQEKYEHSAEDAKLIGENLFYTKINLFKRSYDHSIKKLGTSPDNSEWNMNSQEVNAYYEASTNSIFIPRGIMNAPFFDIDGNYYKNLGGLGSVIGHELSHAFDPRDIKFNADGVYDPEWIGKRDMEEYEKLMKKGEEFYNTRTLMDVYHVDGKKTLNENFADLGGIECVLSLADSDEDKRDLFENYALIWGNLILNTAVIDAVTEDEHSPSLVRVNSVLMNMDDFYEVYDVKEGDGMYLAPDKRVKRW